MCALKRLIGKLDCDLNSMRNPVEGGKKSAYEGTYEYTGGTGRFEGIIGKGTYKGERLGGGETGADTYIDFTGTRWKKQ